MFIKKGFSSSISFVKFWSSSLTMKQVIELSATEGYIFGITFHKKSIQIYHIPVLKKL